MAGLAGVENSDVAAQDMAGIKRTLAVLVGCVAKYVTWSCNLIHPRDCSQALRAFNTNVSSI